MGLDLLRGGRATGGFARPPLLIALAARSPSAFPTGSVAFLAVRVATPVANFPVEDATDDAARPAAGLVAALPVADAAPLARLVSDFPVANFTIIPAVERLTAPLATPLAIPRVAFLVNEMGFAAHAVRPTAAVAFPNPLAVPTAARPAARATRPVLEGATGGASLAARS